MTKRNIIICDINIDTKGHNLGYNQYIIDNIYDVIAINCLAINISFLFNSEAKNLLNIPSDVNYNIVSFDKVERYNLKGRISIWKKIVDIANKETADEVIFMDLDQYQIPISLIKGNFLVSGIYFRPHHRIYPSNDNVYNKIASSIKRAKKIFIEKILLSSKVIKHIFILNDLPGTELLNKFHGTSCFKELPDPIFDYPFSTNTRFMGNGNEVTFLIFGALTERKNIINILNAYNQADFSVPTRLLIVGPCSSDSFLSKINEISKQINSTSKGNKIVLTHTEFISDEEMESIHAVIDVSLLIYSNFYGSSGLLGRAAKHKKYVVAPNVGLLKDLVTSFGLGSVVDPTNVGYISESLKEAVRTYRTRDTVGSTKFYDDHHPELFLRVLIAD